MNEVICRLKSTHVTIHNATKGVLDGDSFAYRLGMQMQPAKCIFSTTFYAETLGTADACLEILFIIFRLHFSSSKPIASVDRARVSVFMSELNHITLLLMTYCNTLIPRGKQETLVRRCTTQHCWVGKRVSISSRRRTICICIPCRDAKENPLSIKSSFKNPQPCIDGLYPCSF